MELAEGTERVAAGDYDFAIEKVTEDEIGSVVESFNRMTGDLKSSREQLDQAHTELIASAQRSETQRRNISVILANVAAGVVSTDAEGVVTWVNRSAERILDLEAAAVVGRHWREAVVGERAEIINNLAATAAETAGDHVERQGPVDGQGPGGQPVDSPERPPRRGPAAPGLGHGRSRI